MSAKRKYTFIDLFSGCGGLSEGFYRMGFTALAHVEINHWACETLRKRMAYYGYKNINHEVIEKDITSEDILLDIDKAVAGRSVDVIVGGPPCQAYSTAGRVRDSKGMASDPRNFLFESYVRILEHYRPKFFVFIKLYHKNNNCSGVFVKECPFFWYYLHQSKIFQKINLTVLQLAANWCILI